MCKCIDSTATLGSDCSIGENVVIEESVTVGSGCRIGHGVVIYKGTVIGDNVSIAPNSVLGKQPKSGVMSSVKTESQPPLRIGNGVVIGSCVVLYAGSSIENSAMVADLASIRERCVIGDSSTIGRCVCVEFNVSVGARTRIQCACVLTGNMVIEEDVFIGADVIFVNDNYMASLEMPLSGAHVKKGTKIGNNSTVLAGLTIGENCFIGAGALVDRDIPDGHMFVTDRSPRLFLEPSFLRPGK
jgi:UDP-3-O-[3-hydroxymyristoyl] glucosamine N-acyltransferase